MEDLGYKKAHQITIPLRLLQTGTGPMDSARAAEWSSSNPGLEYVFLDEDDGAKYFRKEWSTRHAAAYCSLRAGPARAAFLRLHYVAQHGGWYADTALVPGPRSLLDVAAQLYAGRFFYQLYFQEEGVVEAEVGADYRGALRRIYYSLSGDAPLDDWIRERPATESLLQDKVDPDPFPAWMSEADLDVYVKAFEAGGFRGPINRYRAQRLDVAEREAVRGQNLKQPSCFIGGERDAIRHFIPGVEDLYAAPGAYLDDFRGTTIIPEAGHWVQQEAPEAVNAALEAFLATL